MNLKQQDRKILSPLSQFANNNSPFKNKREVAGSQIDKLSQILAGFSDMLDKKINLMMQNNQNKKKYEDQREGQYEPRFKELRFPIQNIKNLSDTQQRQKKIKIFCSDLARKILAIGFKYFEQGKLSQQKLRHFFCNNFLFNVIQYCTQNKLTEGELKMMDGHLKDKVFVFLQERYPQNQNNEGNSKFDKLVHLVDNIQSNSNDLVFMSGVKFTYKKNGDYSKQIMQFLNFLIKLSSPEQKIYEEFKKQMAEIFQKVFDQQWMTKTANHQFVDHSMPNNFQDTIKLSKKDIKQEADKEKYKKSVKQYTKYLIGKKVSDSVTPFTNNDISEQNLKVNNPSIMRILTKWCEQLQKCFDEININSRSQRFRMEDGSERNLKKESRQSFYVNLCLKHKDVKSFIKQSMDNIYQNQFYMFDNPSTLSTFRDFSSEDEGKVGYFASAMKKSYENYLISYLNKLIHSILSAQQLLKANQKKKQQYKFAINQISFKLGDLFRCKISSKEDQIINLYSYLKYYCQHHKDKLQIIRVKNRLSQSTKDILINLKYKQKIVVQMQLSINEDISNFMKCSSAVKHFLYEIQRATFGPLSQLCNVYSTFDPRAEFFRKNFEAIQRERKKPEKQNFIPSIKIISECTHENMEQSSFPCWCSICNKFSYSLNTALKNRICTNTMKNTNTNTYCRCKYTKCSKCSISNPERAKELDFKLIRIEMREKQKQKEQEGKKKIIKQQSIKKLKVLDLQVKKNIQKTFYLLYYNFKFLFFQENKQKNSQLSLISSAKNKHQFDQFLKGKQVQSLQNVPQEEANKISPKMNNEILRNYMITLENKKKKHFIFEQINISQQVFKQKVLLDVQTVIIRGLPFLTSTQNLPLAFPKARIIMINKNKIKMLVNVQKWSEAYQLNLEGNQLRSISPNIKQLQKLNFLVLSKNKFTQFPVQVCQIPNLKILNIKNNAIKSIGREIRAMKNLQILRLTNNGLMNISEQFSQLKNLKQLDLSDNKLLILPDGFKDLVNLQTLSMENNDIYRLDKDIFANMKNLTKIYFTNNKCSRMPSSLFKDKNNLKLIDFAQNQLKVVNPFIFLLPSLSQLTLNNNQITELITTLQGKQIKCPLKKLFLDNNKFKKIPSWINDLKNLQKLRIGNQNLNFEMELIQKLTNLKQIALQNMKISEFPKVLFDFKKLQKISLRNNKLSTLPANICQMRLTEIDLSKNEFTFIPKQLTSMTTLESFLINNNKIIEIPEDVTKLTKLQKFACTGNIIVNILQLLNVTGLAQLETSSLKLEEQMQFRNKFERIKLTRTDTLSPPIELNQQFKYVKKRRLSQHYLADDSDSQKSTQKSSQS